jgi:hypothetical protein
MADAAEETPEEKDQDQIDDEDEAKEAAIEKAKNEPKLPVKTVSVADPTVTPAQFNVWRTRNAEYYKQAEPLTIPVLVKRLAEEKKRFTTTKLENEDPEKLVDRYTYALVYADVLTEKLAEKYGDASESDAPENQFKAAHVAWAAALTTQYCLFFHSIAYWVKSLGKDAPMATLYERLKKAGFVTVM